MEDELFSVFEAPKGGAAAQPASPAPASAANGDAPAAQRSPKKSKKRTGGATEESPSVAGPSSAKASSSPAPKKARKESPPKELPVVADTFETEASRQVAASGGLQGDASQAGEHVVLSHQVRHQVALPPSYPYVPIASHKPPAEPARTYPFTLDPFQKVSVASIERNESVLVSAHTSAGKTVVAEYAIAQCLRDKQRVIYTSPIKVRCSACIWSLRLLMYRHAGFE